MQVFLKIDFRSIFKMASGCVEIGFLPISFINQINRWIQSGLGSREGYSISLAHDP